MRTMSHTPKHNGLQAMSSVRRPEAFALCHFLSAAVRSAPRESLRPAVGRPARVAQARVCGTKMESAPAPRGELEASRAVTRALVERLGVESAKTVCSAWKIRSFPYPNQAKENSSSLKYACI